MFSSKILTKSLIVTFLLYGVSNSDGAERRDPCLGVLPSSLEKKINEQYRDEIIVSLTFLDSYHKKLFLKDHKGKCPGIAKVDLYGNGRQVYAIVLTSRSETDRKSKLVIAERVEGEQWKITVLQDNTTGPTPVVVGAPAGEYEHVYGERVLKSKHEVIAYIGYESWAVVYAWNGKEIEKIQISD